MTLPVSLGSSFTLYLLHIGERAVSWLQVSPETLFSKVSSLNMCDSNQKRQQQSPGHCTHVHSQSFFSSGGGSTAMLVPVGVSICQHRFGIVENFKFCHQLAVSAVAAGGGSSDE